MTETPTTPPDESAGRAPATAGDRAVVSPVSAPALRPTRSRYLVALAVLIAAVVWFFVALELGLGSLGHRVERFQRLPVPGQTQISIDKPGGYVIYAELPAGEASVAVPPMRVVIAPTDGSAPLPVQRYQSSLAYSLAGHAGHALGAFQVQRPGRFFVLADPVAEPPAGTEVAIGPSIGPGLARTVLVAWAGAVVLFLGGAALAVVTAVARRRARRRLRATATAPGMPGSGLSPGAVPATANPSPGSGAGHPAVRLYLLKQKLASLAGALTITDELGRPRFTVQGKLLAADDRLSFRDLDGHELAVVEQRLRLGLPCYEIRRDGQVAATVRQTAALGQRLQIDLPGTDGLHAAGDFLGTEYAFTRDGHTVATATRRWTLGDAYGVEVAAGEDDVLILALMVAIERLYHAAS